MRNFKHFQRAAFVLAFLAPAASVPAAVYVGTAYEGFDYAAGNMGNTLNGGTGWNATGDAGSANTTTWGVGTNLTPGGTAANQAITGAGISYANPGFPASTGSAAQISGVGATGQIGRSLGQTVDAGTFYFSYLTQKTVAELRSTNIAFFGTNERLAIGQIASNLNTRDQEGTWLAGAGANSGNFVSLLSNSQNTPVATVSDPLSYNGVYVNQTAPVAFTANSTFLIIGKVEFGFNAGVEDRFTLYINPGNLSDENSLTPYMVVDHNDFGSLTGFRIFSGATGGGFNATTTQVDEIRFGSSFAQVVPEPGSAAMLVLGGAALLIRRRKHD